VHNHYALSAHTDVWYNAAVRVCALRAMPKLSSSDGGVMLFLLSLVLTRGVDSVRSDMDDVTHLTAQFGYCTQVHTLNCTSFYYSSAGVCSSMQ
jgi:Domain of unknown function (DUF4205)